MVASLSQNQIFCVYGAVAFSLKSKCLIQLHRPKFHSCLSTHSIQGFIQWTDEMQLKISGQKHTQHGYHVFNLITKYSSWFLHLTSPTRHFFAQSSNSVNCLPCSCLISGTAPTSYKNEQQADDHDEEYRYHHGDNHANRDGVVVAFVIGCVCIGCKENNKES